MKPIHWLRFYRKPLTYLAFMGWCFYLVGYLISIILTKGPEPLALALLFFTASGAGIYSYKLYKWRKQFIQWKFQSFQRGGSHSSHLEEYDDSEYRKRFESK